MGVSVGPNLFALSPLFPPPKPHVFFLPSPRTTARSRRTVGMGRPVGGKVASLPLVRLNWVRPTLRAKDRRRAGCTCFPTCDDANRAWTPWADLAEQRRKSARTSHPASRRSHEARIASLYLPAGRPAPRRSLPHVAVSAGHQTRRRFNTRLGTSPAPNHYRSTDRGLS